MSQEPKVLKANALPRLWMKSCERWMPSARMGNPEDADHSLVVIKIDDHTFADAKQSGSQFLILLGMIPRARSYQTPSPLLAFPLQSFFGSTSEAAENESRKLS